MKQVNVYLNFPGTCEAALNFYKDALGGEITSLQRMGDAPVDAPEQEKNLVMHATFKADGVDLMASDGNAEHPVTHGNQITLNLNFDDEAEQTAVFDKLAAGGQVTMPLEDTFWNARFGMLTDKFGIPWMFNCEKK